MRGLGPRTSGAGGDLKASVLNQGTLDSEDACSSAADFSYSYSQGIPASDDQSTGINVVSRDRAEVSRLRAT